MSGFLHLIKICINRRLSSNIKRGKCLIACQLLKCNSDIISPRENKAAKLVFLKCFLILFYSSNVITFKTVIHKVNLIYQIIIEKGLLFKKRLIALKWLEIMTLDHYKQTGYFKACKRVNAS